MLWGKKLVMPLSFRQGYSHINRILEFSSGHVYLVNNETEDGQLVEPDCKCKCDPQGPPTGTPNFVSIIDDVSLISVKR